jgi:hypothetical protein
VFFQGASNKKGIGIMKTENVQRALAIMHSVSNQTVISCIGNEICLNGKSLCIDNEDGLEVLQVFTADETMDKAARHFEGAANAIRIAQYDHAKASAKLSA